VNFLMARSYKIPDPGKAEDLEKGQSVDQDEQRFTDLHVEYLKRYAVRIEED